MQDFSTWIKYRITKYDFVENLDFVRFHKKMEANNANLKEYYITLDTAKELCMVENNEQGKKARKYFIEAEKKLKDTLAPAIPTNLKDALYLAYKQQEEIDKQQELIKQAQPKIAFADAVANYNGTILIGELAKVLNQNGIDIGQRPLFQWLRDNGYLMKHKNTPTQKAMDLELFFIKETVITKSDGTSMISLTTTVTGKGQLYFVDKFKKYNTLVG